MSGGARMGTRTVTVATKTRNPNKYSEVVTKLKWKNRKDRAEVIFYRIENGGHTWPGSPIVHTANWAGETNKNIVASELIWKFFAAHPRW